MKLKKKPDILQDSSPETLRGTKLFSHLIMWTIIACIIVFLVWANYAILDEVTMGEGKVIPSRQIQVIQNLEGGIVKDILVKQGDVVEKGQILILLDGTLFRSKFN